ncbi:MerR family transcriptional regulator [Lentilactobacillus parafarraginis]|jgi:DNA-binding transcriptional MerR regulator|nr:MerR family transcriptional regulator [Lentilactobacillus parafarraginis]EHL99117.1 transcriptional regulator, MerR family [Lentilactobacillus parafarraginis F0439]TLQ17974.1 MerR family transcriptional regulator [Lentilactobacillus parafarraginis]
MAEKQSNEPLIDSDKLIFGIGQVQTITGVSGRQLRYWEEQGYIAPIDQQKGTQRQYSMHMLFLIFHIQRYLKQGFTLQSAVERARQFDRQIPVLRTFLKNQFNGVEVEDDKSVIDFGYKDDTHQQRVYGVVENDRTHFLIKDIDETSK